MIVDICLNFIAALRNNLLSNIFLKIYLAFQSLTRIFLFFYSGHYNQVAWQEIIKIFSIGFVNDIIFFIYIFPIFLIIQVMFTRKVRNCLSFVHFAAALLFVLILLLSLNLIAEVLFWNEYEMRYNFITLEYIVGANQLSALISESFSFIRILVVVVIITSLLTKLMIPALRVACCSINNIHNFFFIFLFSGLSIFLFLNYDSNSLKSLLPNKTSAYLAKNGFYELSVAFKNGDNLDYAEFYPKLPEIEAEEIIENVKIEPINNKYQNINGKNYNVVLIVVESLNAEFLKQLGGRDDLTPNLNKMASESVLFTDLYASGTRTSRAISSLTLSSLPTPGVSIIHHGKNGKDIFNLSSVLKNNGYQNFFAYGGYGYFDSLNKYFAEDGYLVLDRAKFSNKERSFANFWGVADEDLFAKSLEYLDDFNSRNRSFFSIILTTSSHFPYTIPQGRIDVGGLEPKLASIKYADYAIGKFFDSARTKSWFKNTIFLITADHCSTSKKGKDFDLERYHIPLLIYAPEILRSEENHNLASQIDIAPTILGLLGVSYNKYESFGVDLMRNNPRRAFIGTYHTLGYVKEQDDMRKLILLSPQNEAQMFDIKNSETLVSNKSDAKLVREAISFFQRGL
jgi:phosphoglycerol transferase MdoB-like AlkP superfamily enzyme